jgi:hypothetical protein
VTRRCALKRKRSSRKRGHASRARSCTTPLREPARCRCDSPGIVVSPAFASKPEPVRQSEVWRRLLDALSDEEHAQVAFVYTNTPEEKAEAEREAAARG